MQNHPTSEESVPVRHLRLSALKTSEVGLITKVFGHGSFRNRITEMGFIRGKIVKVIKNAPLQDPVEYEIMGYRIALRHSEAELIEVMPISELPKLKLETDSLDDFKHHRSHHQHNRKRHSKVWRAAPPQPRCKESCTYLSRMAGRNPQRQPGNQRSPGRQPQQRQNLAVQPRFRIA